MFWIFKNGPDITFLKMKVNFLLCPWKSIIMDYISNLFGVTANSSVINKRKRLQLHLLIYSLYWVFLYLGSVLPLQMTLFVHFTHTLVQASKNSYKIKQNHVAGAPSIFICLTGWSSIDTSQTDFSLKKFSGHCHLSVKWQLSSVSLVAIVTCQFSDNCHLLVKW